MKKGEVKEEVKNYLLKIFPSLCGFSPFGSVGFYRLWKKLQENKKTLKLFLEKEGIHGDDNITRISELFDKDHFATKYYKFLFEEIKKEAGNGTTDRFQRQ